jgi:DtxR family Mn-dependent transcriptional regulator
VRARPGHRGRVTIAEPVDPSLTRSERETLKAIYRLTRERAEAQTGALADALGVAPGTVTVTVKRLADRSLVDHRPYHGVLLTSRGRRLAVAAIRRHRIVERFLADMLGYAWNEADRLAGTFEHDLPQEVEDRIFLALDRPATCPHGFPIPALEAVDIPAMPPLYALEPGDVATVAVLRPGVSVEVREKHPFDGPLVLRVAGRDRTLGATVANQVFVRPTRGSLAPDEDAESA